MLSKKDIKDYILLISGCILFAILLWYSGGCGRDHPYKEYVIEEKRDANYIGDDFRALYDRKL